jgi:hypothetical protein
VQSRRANRRREGRLRPTTPARKRSPDGPEAFVPSAGAFEAPAARPAPPTTEIHRQLGSGHSTSSGPLLTLVGRPQRQRRLPRLRAAKLARARFIRAAALRSGCLPRKGPSTSPRSGPLWALVDTGPPNPAPTARPHGSPGHRPGERAPKSIPRFVGINLVY